MLRAETASEGLILEAEFTFVLRTVTHSRLSPSVSDRLCLSTSFFHLPVSSFLPTGRPWCVCRVKTRCCASRRRPTGRNLRRCSLSWRRLRGARTAWKLRTGRSVCAASSAAVLNNHSPSRPPYCVFLDIKLVVWLIVGVISA